jgi:hypothetical protein
LGGDDNPAVEEVVFAEFVVAHVFS